MIILYEIAYGVYDATRIFMTRQAQTHTHTCSETSLRIFVVECIARAQTIPTS